MIQYTFSYSKPHRHFVDIEMCVEKHNASELILQLPAWRPGRYELADFAKNIQQFSVMDAHGNPLKYEKITKDTWKVSTPNISEIIVKYNYYANELNAGSTYVDENLLYVNPLNCCLFIPNRIEETCAIELQIPESYEIACSLPQKNHQLIACNFNELAESPWVASNSLQHKSYEVESLEFHVWFLGACSPDWNRIIADFKAFTIQQIKDFTAFPVAEYHFINLMLPYKASHGVEHTANTVISLGPGEDLMSDKMYASLLGVSSHELYHTWNVKQIRPTALLPYDYTKENYSRMGYLYEGVTTYMGDLYLKRSKVFSESEFYKTQEENLQKHFHNGARTNMSVADSSFDTWLDGYVIGIPNRKVSIYTEGALCALMLDILILHNNAGQKSLRTLMTKLYIDYACKAKGLSEDDYIHELLSFGGNNALAIVQNHLYGTKDFRASLDEVLALVGLQIIQEENPDLLAASLGIKGLFSKTGFEIKTVQENSISDVSKIAVGDIILEVNGKPITKELLTSLSAKGSAVFKVKRRFETIDLEISLLDKSHYQINKIITLDTVTVEQEVLFAKWCN
tara:strand:- start:926 stop:2635 length:1710 start_codon:yes stop_codon:yes gene_type:complete